MSGTDPLDGSAVDLDGLRRRLADEVAVSAVSVSETAQAYRTQVQTDDPQRTGETLDAFRAAHKRHKTARDDLAAVQRVLRIARDDARGGRYDA